MRLTTLPPSCADCLEILAAPTYWSPMGMSRPVYLVQPPVCNPCTATPADGAQRDVPGTSAALTFFRLAVRLFRGGVLLLHKEWEARAG